MLIVAVIVISGCTQETAKPKETVSQSTIENKEITPTQPSEPPASETTKFLTYDNSAYGIKIKYSPDWTKNEQILGTVAVFLSPQESASDIFQENLNVIVQEMINSFEII